MIKISYLAIDSTESL